MKFHRMMRGRYKWAAVVAFVGLLGGVLAGLKLGTQTYQSVGALRIRMDRGGGGSYNTQTLESYAEAKASMLRSARVREQAMDSPGWAELNKASDTESKLRFADSIQVMRQLDAIVLRVEDRKPEVAQKAVNLLMQSFVSAQPG